jgi:hypothetical protein
MTAMTEEKPVVQYVVWTVVDGADFDTPVFVPKGKKSKLPRERVFKVFNKAWGFEDGECNARDSKGNLVSKPDYPEGFEDAQRRLSPSNHCPVLVSVFKDGRKEFSFLKIDPSDQSCAPKSKRVRKLR